MLMAPPPVPPQAKVWACFLLNGCIFLGSVYWWRAALYPACHWLLRQQAQQVRCRLRVLH